MYLSVQSSGYWFKKYEITTIDLKTTNPYLPDPIKQKFMKKILLACSLIHNKPVIFFDTVLISKVNLTIFKEIMVIHKSDMTRSKLSKLE